jgi:hypothetical protein
LSLYQTFVSLCMNHRRPEFVREVMKCAADAGATPAAAQGRRAEWFRMLCSATEDGHLVFSSPASEIEGWIAAKPRDFREFLVMTAEYLPTDEGLSRLRNSDSDETRALVVECEMESRIRQVNAGQPAQRAAAAAAADPTWASDVVRRRRYV